MRFTQKLSGWQFDLWLIIPMLVLMVVGLVILYSLGLSVGTGEFTNFYRQLWFVPFGLFIFLAVSFLDYRWYYHYAKFIYWFAAALLVAVLLFGESFRGTTGWFVWSGIVWQPVEIVKIFWVIWIAYYFVASNYKEHPIRTLVTSLLHLGILVGLIFLQPDLGSALLFIVSWFFVLFLLSFPRKYLMGLIVVFVIMAMVGWFFIFADYQKERVRTFVNPEADPLGSGYNVRQSIIAIGAGQFWGRGVAQGTQSQLRFLPESQTDFIVAVIGEELGFVGMVIVLASWLLIFWRMYNIGVRTVDNFSSILMAGILALFGSQVVINIGMSLGLFPITGLGLPLVSYGRSSLLSTLIAFGIVVNISRSVRAGSPLRVT